MKGVKFNIEDRTYFYDTPTNKMLRLPERNSTRDKEFVDYMRENHNLLSNRPFKQFSFGRVDEDIYRGIDHLIVNMTNQCNFRCVYCKYSGDYEGVPEHHDVEITTDLLDKVIAFMKNLDIKDEFQIGFYGGEPLMQFDKIVHFVETLKATFPATEFHFSLTTNGSYLGRDRVKRFLIDHGFFTNISLDGPRQSMKYRIFLNGKPVYDFVYKNLTEFKQMDPEYYMSRVGFSVVLAPPCDLDAIFEFFCEDAVYTNGPMFFSNVDSGSNFEKDHNTEEAQSKFRDQFLKYKQRYLDMLAADETGADNKLFRILDSFMGRSVALLHNRPYNEAPVDEIFPVGNCLTGFHKLFIQSDGNFYMCEKESVFHKIGNLDHGIDVPKVKALMASFLEIITDHGCLECPFARVCKLCMAQVSTPTGFSKKDLETYCKAQKPMNLNSLKFYMQAIEANPKHFSKNFENEAV